MENSSGSLASPSDLGTSYLNECTCIILHHLATESYIGGLDISDRDPIGRDQKQDLFGCDLTIIKILSQRDPNSSHACF